MAMSRPATAIDSRRFGRRPVVRSDAQVIPANRLDDDLRLFAATYAGGFLFVSILIG
ncbi:MAG: hypothetical protein ACR2FK_08025 [Sphingomicrobium sp.]